MASIVLQLQYVFLEHKVWRQNRSIHDIGWTKEELGPIAREVKSFQRGQKMDSQRILSGKDDEMVSRMDF